jgi:acetone carboxylase gamma subunit
MEMAKVLSTDRLPGTSYDYRIGRRITCEHCGTVWEVEATDPYYPVFDRHPTGDCQVSCPRCFERWTISPDQTVEIR